MIVLFLYLAKSFLLSGIWPNIKILYLAKSRKYLYFWPNIIMKQVIGRREEKLVFQRLLQSNKPELLAVYGRRRIGKTYMVQKFFAKLIIFEISGLHNGNQREQLENFSSRLSFHFAKAKTFKRPDSWIEGFDQLIECLRPLRISKQKRVLFIDEFPWLATRRSGFLRAFENFWNSFAARREDIIVVICGSAASWMIEKVIKNKGGLHNRITQLVRLSQFSLLETEQFLEQKGIRLSRYDIAQLYMITGGIPFYLDAVPKGSSIAQIIDHLCFSKHGLLRNEFELLFTSLFEHSDRHISLVTHLSKVRRGLTRNEILKKTGLPSGGGLTRTLNELIESGFVSRYLPYGQKSKQTLYRLTDSYCLFYSKFIHQIQGNRGGELVEEVQRTILVIMEWFYL